jgi:glycosyltransferase involved in cell wall biosynthesis
MTAEPRFSVVMPAYNAEATIVAAVRSVLHQSVAELELIVVDDGSTDETVPRLRTAFDDERLSLIEQQNAGPAAARNAGIALARASVVSVIDSDDLWLPNYLEVMGAALDAEPEAGFAYTDAWLYDENRRRVARRSAMSGQRPPDRPPHDPRELLLELLQRNFIYTSASIRRTVLTEVGGYDERFRYGEDFELWLRILEAGHRAVRVRGNLAVHRRTTTSLTADLRRYYQGISDVYAAVAREHDLVPTERAVATHEQHWWEDQRARLDDAGFRRSLERRARNVVARLRDRRRWLEHPPAGVAETLKACGVT